MKIFRNCKLYNQPETVYYKCSNDLEEFIRPHLQALKEGKSEKSVVEKRLTGGKLKKRPGERKTKK